MYLNVGSDASLANGGKKTLDVRGIEVVVDFGKNEEADVARYNVDATKVGLVGKNVVGGVTLSALSLRSLLSIPAGEGVEAKVVVV